MGPNVIFIFMKHSGHKFQPIRTKNASLTRLFLRIYDYRRLRFYFEIWLVCFVNWGESICLAMTVKCEPLLLFTCGSFQYTNFFFFFHPSLLASLPSPQSRMQHLFHSCFLPSFIAETDCQENMKVAVEDVKRKRKKRKAKTWRGAVIFWAATLERK